jgi:hypothetical protein
MWWIDENGEEIPPTTSLDPAMEDWWSIDEETGQVLSTDDEAEAVA